MNPSSPTSAASSYAEVQLDKQKYYPGDLVTGCVFVYVFGHKTKQFDTIKVNLHGRTELQVSARTVGLFDTFNSPPESTVWVKRTQILAQHGVLIPQERNAYSFEFPLAATQSRQFMESLHGLSINTTYSVTVEVKRGMFSRTLTAQATFLVEFLPRKPSPLPSTPTYRFKISNLLVGELDRTRCQLSQPITGSIQAIINGGGAAAKRKYVSVDLELVRLEDVFWGEDSLQEICLVKRIQIADGMLLDSTAEFPVHFSMVIPPTFTCSTFITQEFQVTFQLNVIVTLDDGGDQLVHRIPIVFMR